MWLTKGKVGARVVKILLNRQIELNRIDIWKSQYKFVVGGLRSFFWTPITCYAK